MAGWRHWRLRPYSASTRTRGVVQPKFWGVTHWRMKHACKALRKKAAAAARRESQKLCKEYDDD